MRWLSDGELDHLRGAIDEPDLSNTKYTLVGLLSRGGMGAVYRVMDRTLEREVALKVLDLPDPNAEDLERIRLEARILARLEHPGIVPVHDLGELPDGRIYYTMKWVRGARLDARVPVPHLEAIDILERACEAVAFAHAHGVVHRDLKPENVMLGEFGEVLILDWGVAKIAERHDSTERRADDRDGGLPARSSQATQPGVIVGTPGYMAPEQERGDPTAIGPWTDVHGLGGLLVFLLSGEIPRAVRTSSGLKLHAEVPRALIAIAEKATHPEPAHRYSSPLELAADLSRFRSGAGVSAHRESILERALRVAVKYRTPILIVLGYLVMRAAILLWLRR